MSGWYEYTQNDQNFIVYFDGSLNVGGVLAEPQPCNGRLMYIWALSKLALGGESETIEEAKKAILNARKFVSI